MSTPAVVRPGPADDPERSVRPPDLELGEQAALHAADPSPRPVRRRLGELPVLLLVALVLAFGIKTFLLQAFYIPSGSMMDTLQINDRVLVEKVTFRFREPERGEVIVFRRPGAQIERGPGAVVRSFLEGIGLLAPDDEIDLIKRVIGLPGETVEIVDGVVSVDGRALSEPYVLPDERSFPAVEVPEGEYFMLGDNRGNSDDSRYGLGTVPRADVVGRAFVILWPLPRATFALAEDLDDP
jgi:signal peptidase I